MMRIFTVTKYAETLRVRKFKARVLMDRCLFTIDDQHRGIDATIDIIGAAIVGIEPAANGRSAPESGAELNLIS